MIYLKCPECGRINSKFGFNIKGQCCICGWKRKEGKEVKEDD